MLDKGRLADPVLSTQKVDSPFSLNSEIHGHAVGQCVGRKVVVTLWYGEHDSVCVLIESANFVLHSMMLRFSSPERARHPFLERGPCVRCLFFPAVLSVSRK
jgi:hypothetical protein